MARSENIEKLSSLLSEDENGDEIAESLVKIFADDDKSNIFVIKLEELKKFFSEMDKKIKLTPLEKAVKTLIKTKKHPFTAIEVSEKLGNEFPSLRHRNHSSATLNSLVSKGQLGKIKEGHVFLFAEPSDAVLESLKRRHETLEKNSTDVIARETGMPLNVVLEIIGELQSN